MSRLRYSAEVKRHAVDLAQHSSLTEVARQVGCSIHSLRSWIKKYRHEQNANVSTPPTFVPITLVDPKPSVIEIITPNGFTIRLHSPISLGELLAAISPC